MNRPPLGTLRSGPRLCPRYRRSYSQLGARRLCLHLGSGGVSSEGQMSTPLSTPDPQLLSASILQLQECLQLPYPPRQVHICLLCVIHALDHVDDPYGRRLQRSLFCAGVDG